MSDTKKTLPGKNRMSRGEIWLRALTGNSSQRSAHAASVIFADSALGAGQARFIAVVPDPLSRFPRARCGEVGLEQGWALAELIRQTISGHNDAHAVRCPIVAIVDVVGQAYGRREELMGIHLACAAAVNAYADARLAGHPVIALIVGHAMSGAFLAHGYQANRIVSLDAPDVLIHAMGQAAAARITRRSIDQLAELGDRVPPMSYDIHNYAKLGMLNHLIAGVDADAPDAAGIQAVHKVLADTLAAIRQDRRRDLSARYHSHEARTARAASIEVRRRMAEQW